MRFAYFLETLLPTCMHMEWRRGGGEARKSAEPFQAISYASDKLFSTAAQLNLFFWFGIQIDS